MSKFESETAGTPRRSATACVVLVGLLAISLGVLLAAPALSATRDTLTVQGRTVQAIAIVGVVLVEAITLYVWYGALVALVEPSVRELLGGDSAWNFSD